MIKWHLLNIGSKRHEHQVLVHTNSRYKMISYANRTLRTEDDIHKLKLGSKSMSFDYFLVSPKHKRSCCVGSIGLGGTSAWPATEECIAFFKWAMEENIKDIVLVNENEMDQIEEKWEAEELNATPISEQSNRSEV